MCTWVGVNSHCGDGNLLAAHWLTDVVMNGCISDSVRAPAEKGIQIWRG